MSLRNWGDKGASADLEPIGLQLKTNWGELVNLFVVGFLTGRWIVSSALLVIGMAVTLPLALMDDPGLKAD